jgi:alanyl aminopeptidase
MGNLDGNARLPEGVVPLAYDVDLRVDPRGEEAGTLEGKVQITVRVEAATSRIAMHAEGMVIEEAKVDGSPARALLGKNGGLELEVGGELAVGEHVIELEYEAALDGAPEGLYRVKSGEDWYAFTQFEPLEAREAFPCFDEPGFKTPFTVSIEAPDGMLAAANAPETGRGEGVEGFVRYDFAKTQPLPTYLVALAVGPFDVVETPEGTIPGVPLRALVPKGKAALADYALKHTPEILANLEGYFGQAYPYEKLDLVAVPNFRFGAMENVGLVTFRESLMLIDADKSTGRERHALRSVTAHELAHMWFGNYVTPTWWDELWLNESFATWMASKVMIALYPESEEAVRNVRGLRWVMGADSKAQTRAIRQPITNGGDVYNAFDGITYGKGAAVLRMTERWIGEDAMRAGVRAYMEANPHGSVETASLMGALEEASGKPVYEVLKTFLDQPGVPVLEVGDVVCAPGGQGGATVALTQSRYAPAGTQVEQGATWSIPVCVKYASPTGEVSTTCEVLSEREGLIKLDACPAWLYPNADVGGYYMWDTSAQGSPEATSREIFGELTRAERIAAVGNLKRLLEAERMKAGEYFHAVVPQVGSTDDLLASEGLGALGMMAEVAREAGKEEEYAALVRRWVGPLVERLGLEPAAGEAPDVGRLRISALTTLARWGQDEWAMGNARGLIGAFTADPDAMPSWRARWVVPLSAARGDERLWEEMRAALPKAKSPRARGRVLSGLGSFEEPELLARSLELALTEEVYGGEFWSIYGPAMGDATTRAQAWAWFKENYDAIAAKLGEGALADMPYFGSGFCDAQGKAEVEAYFGEKVGEVDGMDRNLSMVLEGIGQCARRRAYIREAALEWIGAGAKE